MIKAAKIAQTIPNTQAAKTLQAAKHAQAPKKNKTAKPTRTKSAKTTQKAKAINAAKKIKAKETQETLYTQKPVKIAAAKATPSHNNNERGTNQEFTAIVEGLTNDGAGFAYKDGKRLYFKGFLPGDKIRLVLNSKNRYEAAGLIEPSKNRIKSDCAFYGPCGGCSLCELSEKARIKEKQAMIERALERVLGGAKAVLRPFTASPSIIRYLPRVRLHQSKNYNERESGFLASDEFQHKGIGSVVPVNSCAIITKPLNRRMAAARKILNELPIFLERLILMSSSSDRADRVVGHAVLAKGQTEHYHREHLLKLMRAINLKGLSVAGFDRKIKKAYGELSVTGLIAPNVEGAPYEAEPSVFVQGNIFLNEQLINRVIELCQIEKGTRVLEGFAGAGNFSLALAAQGAVVEAIELSAPAVRIGLKNIAASPFKNNIKLYQGDALKDLIKSKLCPDVLLLDPPRTGTTGIEKIAARLNPKRIVCVFCSLDALEKDCAALIKAGYQINDVSGFDLYPRTHHVEAVVLLTQ